MQFDLRVIGHSVGGQMTELSLASDIAIVVLIDTGYTVAVWHQWHKFLSYVVAMAAYIAGALIRGHGWALKRIGLKYQCQSEINM